MPTPDDTFSLCWSYGDTYCQSASIFPFWKINEWFSLMQCIENRNWPVHVPWFYKARTWLQYRIISSRVDILDKLTPANLRIEEKAISKWDFQWKHLSRIQRGCSCSSRLERLLSWCEVLGSIPNAWQKQNQTKSNQTADIPYDLCEVLFNIFHSPVIFRWLSPRWAVLLFVNDSICHLNLKSPHFIRTLTKFLWFQLITVCPLQ